MIDGGVRHDLRPGARLAPVGVALLVLVVLGAGWIRYAGRAAERLHLAAGFVVSPAGARLVDGDDGPELRFPGDRVPSVLMRVPVRNGSRLSLTVHHLAEPGAEDAPRRVRIEPGGTAWLEIRDDSGGCAGERGGGGHRYYRALTVLVQATAGPERTVSLPLPAVVVVPTAASCVPRVAS